MSLVKKISFKQYKGKVYDLNVNKEHTYNVEGKAVHNSAGGSLVSYCLRITNVDPIKYKLLFERFLDASRLEEIIESGQKPSANDLPDVDLDFKTDMKDEIKDYLVEKYGEKQVCSIGTVGYMRVKGLLKNLGRVLGIDDSEINHLTTVGLKELTPDDESLEITELQSKFPMLRAYLDKHPELGENFNRLYGSINALGRHPAGMIVTDIDLTEHLPVRLEGNQLVSCWSEGIQGRELGTMGFVKMDFLNIETLDTIEEMLELIEKRHGKKYDMSNIPLDDYTSLSQLNKQDNLGIFQFDTHLANKVVDAMGGIKQFEDLAALSALMRPGALQNNFDSKFGELRKSGEAENIPESLKPYFGDTLGLPIFQEQAFFFAKHFAKLSNVESYNYMKTLYKAKMDDEQEKSWRKKIIDDAIAKGSYDVNYKRYAEDTFEQLLKFQNYSFNKSHAIAYSVYSAVQLWIKQNYPMEFWCATLNAVNRSVEKKGVHLLDQRVRNCISIGINVTPPDVNKSGYRWTIDGNTLVGSLINIKGFGKADVEQIINNRPYNSLQDFIDKTKVSKTKFETLLFAGALSKFGKINDLYNLYDTLYNSKGGGTQLQLFFDEDDAKEDVFFSQTELDEKFLDLNGFLITENLINKYNSYIKDNDITNIGRVLSRKRGNIKTFGKVTSMNVFTARSKTKWCKVVLSDGVDYIEFLVNNKIAEIYSAKLKLGNILSLYVNCTGKGFFLGDTDRFDINIVSEATNE